MNWRGVRLRRPKDPDTSSVAAQMTAVSDNMMILSKQLRSLVREQTLIEEAAREKGGSP